MSQPPQAYEPCPTNNPDQYPSPGGYYPPPYPPSPQQQQQQQQQPQYVMQQQQPYQMQTGVAYYGGPGGLQQQQPGQQPQSTCVVVGPQQPQMIIVTSPPPQSFVGHIVLACFAFWCCGCVFGLVAFILAVVASNQVHRFPASARQLGRASMGVSIVGIVLPVVGVVLFIVIVLILTTTSHPVQACAYRSPADGRCFAHKRLMAESQCQNFIGRPYYDDITGYCYYD